MGTRTEMRIAEFVVWSALVVYAAVWFAGLGFGLGGKWLLAGWVTAVYVGMHIYEITYRHHCYLSADSTAFPTTLILFSLTVVGMWAAGSPPLPSKPLILAWGYFSLVFGGGHLAALAYSATLETILTFVYSDRSAAEREELSEKAQKMEEVVATYMADTDRHRAVVVRLSNGAYRCEVERLCAADDAGGVVHGTFWSRIPGFRSYTNDLAQAEMLAQENLRCAQAVEP